MSDGSPLPGGGAYAPVRRRFGVYLAPVAPLAVLAFVAERLLSSSGAPAEQVRSLTSRLAEVGGAAVFVALAVLVFVLEPFLEGERDTFGYIRATVLRCVYAVVSGAILGLAASRYYGGSPGSWSGSVALLAFCTTLLLQGLFGVMAVSRLSADVIRIALCVLAILLTVRLAGAASDSSPGAAIGRLLTLALPGGYHGLDVLPYGALAFFVVGTFIMWRRGSGVSDDVPSHLEVLLSRRSPGRPTRPWIWRLDRHPYLWLYIVNRRKDAPGYSASQLTLAVALVAAGYFEVVTGSSLGLLVGSVLSVVFGVQYAYSESWILKGEGMLAGVLVSLPRFQRKVYLLSVLEGLVVVITVLAILTAVGSALSLSGLEVALALSLGAVSCSIAAGYLWTLLGPQGSPRGPLDFVRHPLRSSLIRICVPAAVGGASFLPLQAVHGAMTSAQYPLAVALSGGSFVLIVPIVVTSWIARRADDSRIAT